MERTIECNITIQRARLNLIDRFSIMYFANRGFITMSTIDEIKTAVRKLPPEELSTFRAWFAEFDADAWDQQFEQDVAKGRLDALAEEALRDLHEGRCRDL